MRLTWLNCLAIDYSITLGIIIISVDLNFQLADAQKSTFFVNTAKAECILSS